VKFLVVMILSLQRGKRGRHQDAVGDRGDDRAAVGFGFGARLDRFGIGADFENMCTELTEFGLLTVALFVWSR
jgi:hypothetical protein